MEKLPESHFPLQNLELERTDLYTFEGDKEKPLILFGLRGPGGMNCLWPVVEKLASENYPIDLLIDSAAKKILSFKKSEFKKQRLESPLRRIMELKPKVAVSEFSADSGTALALTWSEQSYGVPTIWVEDFPDVLGSYTSLLSSSLRINPTYMCAISEFSKKLVEKRKPTLNPGRIFVTGHPDYDKYHEIDGLAIRKDVRKSLELSDDQFLIVYSGLLPPETTGILGRLIEDLKQVNTKKELVLLLSKHPRDAFPEEDYEKILSKFDGRVIRQGDFTSDQISYACDLLVAPGPSTEALKCAYRGVPSLHIIPPDFYPDFPEIRIPLPVKVGASVMVENYGDLKGSLEKVINDDGFRSHMLEIAREEFKTEGKAAERIAEVIKETAGKE